MKHLATRMPKMIFQELFSLNMRLRKIDDLEEVNQPDQDECLEFILGCSK